MPGPGSHPRGHDAPSDACRRSPLRSRAYDNPADRRRFHRYDLRGIDHCDVQRGSRPQALRLLNMSLTGLAVESNQAMRIGDPYRLSVHGDGQQVEIDAEVQWSRLVRASCGRAGARYQAGLDFTRFLDDRAPDILRFLKDHVVIHVLRRLEGRLDVWDGTVLDRHCRLLVRQISVHHMYLATDSSPAPAVGQSVQVHIQDPSLYLAPDGTIAFVDRTVPREFGRGCHVMVELTDLSLVNRLLLESFVCDVLE